MEIFEVTVRRGDGEVVVALRGELDLNGTALLDQHLRPLTGQYDADQVVIDCAELDLIDLHGIRGLVRIARITRHTGRMRMRNVSSLMAEVLDLIGHAETFEIEDDVSVA